MFATYSQHKDQHRNSVKITQNVFIYLRSGKKLIHTENRDYEIHSGEAIILKRGSYIMSEITPKYEAFLFFYDDNVFLDLINKYPSIKELFRKDTGSKTHFKVEKNPFLSASIESIANYFSTPASSELVKLKFEEIFLSILNSPAKEDFINFLKPIYESARKTVLQKIEQNIEMIDSVEDMADILCLSPSAFRKKFKSEVGIPPKQWLDDKRLEKAVMFLRNSSLNITEISSQCGFFNSSWFTKKFKERHGVSPKQYRIENC